jgi:ankyrin repeat protein
MWMLAARFWSRFARVASALTLMATLHACTPSPHDLVAANNVAVLQTRLEADPALVDSRDRLGKTPLHHAVTYNRIPIMPLLAGAGSDLDAQDSTGMTPLHGAALLGNADAAKWLAEAGATLEAFDAFGSTPAHTAAIFGRSSVLRVLTAFGANLAAKNAAGMTPLQAARHYGNEETASNILRLIAWSRGKTLEERLENLNL